MGRLFIIIGLGVAMLVTMACDNGGKNRIPLKKTTTPGKGQVSEKTTAINEAIKDKTCLRVDLLIEQFMKQKDETVLIYTHNLDMGNLTFGPNKSEMAFHSQIDPKTRAHVFLKNDVEPILEVVAAQDLQSKTKVAFLLSPTAIDEKCETVAFETIAKAQFNVVKKDGSTLWLQNKNDPSELIRYMYNRKDKLFITHYTPAADVVCGKQPRMLMRSYVVAREEGLENIELDREFAKLIADNTEEPIELTAELTKTGRTSHYASMSYATLARIHGILRDEKFVQPACP